MEEQMDEVPLVDSEEQIPTTDNMEQPGSDNEIVTETAPTETPTEIAPTAPPTETPTETAPAPTVPTTETIQLQPGSYDVVPYEPSEIFTVYIIILLACLIAFPVFSTIIGAFQRRDAISR